MDIVFPSILRDNVHSGVFRIIPFQYLRRSDGFNLKDMIQARFKLEYARLACEEWDYFTLLDLDFLLKRLGDYQQGRGDSLSILSEENKVELTCSLDTEHRIIKLEGKMPPDCYYEHLRSTQPAWFLTHVMSLVKFDLPLDSAGLEQVVSDLHPFFAKLQML